VDGPTAAGGRVQAGLREVDSTEDDLREVDSLEVAATAGLFPAAACRVAAAACRAVPALGACGRGALAVAVLGPSARVLAACELAQGVPAGDVPQAAGDVRRWLLRVLLPVQDDCRVAVSRPGQAGLGGCPAAVDDPGRARRAASRRDNWRDSRRLARTTAGKIVSPSLWFPFQVLEERRKGRKGRRFQGPKAKPCVDLPAFDAVSWRTCIGGRAWADWH
jgi:hypothetical protein